jgi:phosphatidylserine decarboxylase
MRNQHTPVAIEGIPFILAAAAAAFVSLLVQWYLLAVPLLLLTLFIVFFFRNPERRLPAEERAVVAPADGRIIFIGPAREEHTGETLTKISIFMSVFNVHINRAPVSGTVVDSYYRPGRFLDVRDERSPMENERKGLVFATQTGLRLVVVQIAGLIARRIICYPATGAVLARGERYGLIRFGSRLDVYLPPEVTLAVTSGQKTTAGETVLGYLP